MAPPTKKQASIWGTVGALVLLAALYAFEHWQKSSRAPSGRRTTTSGNPMPGNSDHVRPPRDATTPATRKPNNSAILRMHDRRAHEKWVEGASIVVKVLRDDDEGSRHQRFLIRVSDDVRVKVAHNIDLAPRVPVRAGDLVSYRGKYVWNELGGALHWTHHDPRNPRRGGWLRHEGKIYE